MCGIVGLATSSSARLSPAIRSAVRAMAHRGPDGEGVFISAPFALGHTRLSIIDLSDAGSQPMQSLDGRFVITYNGEIYNFIELRRELEQRGRKLRGHSDTEVLLECYQIYGPDVFSRLNGIFALGIVDLERRELVVARDHLGVKPVYVAEGTFGFAFASELKALMEVAPIDRVIDPVALRQYLTFLWSPGGKTLLPGVRRLDPGAALLVRDGRIARSWQYWAPPRYAPRRDWKMRDCASELRQRVDAAVHRQMVSDAPLGSFLSGGVDSTSIVAAARTWAPNLNCFTMAVQDVASGEMSDDLPFARLAAKELGVRLTEVPVAASDVAVGVQRMMSDLEEPIADPAAINLRLVAERARADGVKVLLSGTGGDDLMTGYRRHMAASVDHLWSLAPAFVRAKLAQSAAPTFQHLGLRRIAKLLSSLDLSADARIASMFAWIAPKMASGLLAPALRAEGDDQLALEPILTMLAGNQHLPSVERCLELDRRFFLADHNLIYTDKMGMAAGIEIRVPLLDLELLSFAATIPAEWKIRRTTPKWIFKMSQRGRVPAAILRRSKTGFGVPLRKWMNGPLAPLCSDLLSRETLLRRGLFDAAAVARMEEANRKGTIDASYTLFSVMCTEMWARKFIDGIVTPERAERTAEIV